MPENQNASEGMVCRVLDVARDMTFDPWGKACSMTVTALLLGVLTIPALSQEVANQPTVPVQESSLAPVEQVAPATPSVVETPASEVIPQDPLAAPAQVADVPEMGTATDAQVLPDAAVLPVENHDWLRYLSTGADLSLMWDSNIFQSDGSGSIPKVSDWIFGADPWLALQTDGSEWQVGAKAGLMYDYYFDTSSLTSLGYLTSLSTKYDGPKALLDLSIGADRTASVDRYYGTYVELDNLRYGGKYEYKLSSKSTIDNRFGYTSVSPTDPKYSGYQRTQLNSSYTWRLSPLTKVSLGVGWSLSEGDTQVSRTTLGPVARVVYSLSEKVKFEGEVGLDYVSYQGHSDADSEFVSSSMRLVYTSSPFWKWSAGVLTDTVPDGSQAGVFREIYSYQAGVDKKLGNYSLGLNLTYEQNDLSSPTGAAVSGSSQDFITTELSLSRSLAHDRYRVKLFYHYRDQNSSDSGQSWTGSQLGAAVQTKF